MRSADICAKLSATPTNARSWWSTAPASETDTNASTTALGLHALTTAAADSRRSGAEVAGGIPMFWEMPGFYF